MGKFILEDVYKIQMAPFWIFFHRFADRFLAYLSKYVLRIDQQTGKKISQKSADLDFVNVLLLTALLLPLNLCAVGQEPVQPSNSFTEQKRSVNVVNPCNVQRIFPCPKVQAPPPCKPRRGDNLVFVELLVWEAKEENLDFVETAPLAAGVVQPPFAPILGPHSIDERRHYAPGWRIGLGYAWAWEWSAFWTHFYTKQKNSIFSPAMPPLFPIDGASDPIAEGAEAQWKLQFDVADVEAAYLFRANCFRIRPHIGIRGAWINQKFNAFFDDVTYIDSLFPAADYSSVSKNKYWGVGLRGGVDCNWEFWPGLSIFGKSGLSLLYGEFEVTKHVNLENTVSFGPDTFLAGTEISRQKRTHFQMAPAIDLTGGVAWDCGCKSRDLTFSLAWEAQIWFSQNQMLQSNNSFNSVRNIHLKGNLTLQGLTARLDYLF